MEQLARLDALSKPTVGFPQSMEPWFPSIHHGDATVNGVRAEPSPFSVEKGDEVY
ncbi:MAG: hypothetical protein ABI446_04995 [Gemmatimonadaceae bacterium]